MFVKTVKVRKPHPIAIFIALIVVAVLMAIFVFGEDSKAKVKAEVLDTEMKRVEFLTKLGWEVSEEYIDCKVVTVPNEFNDVYNGYNDLQKEQGFNLSKYKGKSVEIYSYEVYNYPEHPQNIIANIIVFEGKLIGGDICSTEIDGFMHGLMPVVPFTSVDSNADSNATDTSLSTDESTADVDTNVESTVDSKVESSSVNDEIKS